MLEDSSQTPADAAVDNSRVVEAQQPVADLAPANQQPPPPTQPQEANADLGSLAAPPDGQAGDGVDQDSNGNAAYLAEVEALRTGLTQPAPVETPAAPPSAAPSTAAPSTVDPSRPVAVDDDSLDDIQPPTDGRSPQIKLRPGNQSDLTLLASYKAAQKAGSTESLSDFVLRTSAPKPSDAPASDATNHQTQEPNSDPLAKFSSLNDLDAEIRRLSAAESQHNQDFNFEEARKARQEYDNLMLKRGDFIRTHEQQQVTQAQAAAEAWNASLNKAKPLFPDAGVAGSALEAAAAQVRQEWEASNHPLATVADSALALYAEAAARINYKPAAAQAAPLSVKPNGSTPSPANRPALSPMIGNGNPAPPTQALDITKTPLKNYEQERSLLLGIAMPNRPGLI